MHDEKFNNWLTLLGKAWMALDPKSASELFSKDVVYYESALNAPCKSWEEVRNLWEVIPSNQKNVMFHFEILSATEKGCFANWQVERTLLPQNTQQKIDGIFLFRLNAEGLCSYFKQWRTVGEE